MTVRIKLSWRNLLVRKIRMAYVLITLPLAITCSICWWTAFYFLVRHTFSYKTPEWCFRILSLFHGSVVAVTGLYECISNPAGVFAHGDNPSSYKQLLIMLTSLGYFLLDLVWCLYHNSETTIMLVHHVFSCVGLCRMLSKGVAGVQTVCGMGCLEVSNPLLQIRWYLRSEGYHNTIWFTSVEIAFLILFFTIRILLGTYCVYEVLFVYPYEWEFRIFTVIIYFISLVFIRDTYKYVWKKYVVAVNIDDVNNNT